MGATATDAPTARRPASSRRRLSSLGQRLGLIPEPGGEHVYHGFISYSHAADGKLAPALQRGLQQFAKPWYRIRALHVFRDEAALSANPALWESVRTALDDSEHYILLASPQAAASEWVGREASYWCEHKSTSTILIALTAGELSFGGDGAAPGADALPPVLRAALPDEPRYIDLRWTSDSSEVLNLSHPRFREAVAELAAPLHGKPKEELSGEEVRQHRRTVRVARSAAGTLVSLLAAAVVAALVAYSQYQTAQSRSLAAQATADLAVDPQHSLSLALQSTQINSGGPGVQALRLALAQAPLRMTIDSGAGDSTHAAWNPALAQIAISGPGDTVQLWNPMNGRVERVLRGPPGATPSLFTSNGPLLYSADGRWIAYVDGAGSVSVWNALTGAAAPVAGLASAIGGARIKNETGLGQLTATWMPQQDALLVWGPTLDRVLAFTPASGAVASLANLPSGAEAVVPSRDGSRLFLAYDAPNNASPGVIVDLSTRSYTRFTPYVAMSGHDACWSADDRTIITWDPYNAGDLVLRSWNASTGTETRALALNNTVSAAACGGTAKQPWLATGDYGGQVVLRISGGLDYGLNGHGQYITDSAPSADGAYLATASDDGTARVWDGAEGNLIRVLPDGSPVNSIRFAPGSGLALTTDQRGLVKIWDTGIGQPSASLASAGPGYQYPLGFARAGSLVYGLRATLARGSNSPASADLVTWSSTTGAVNSQVSLPADIAAAGVPCVGAMKYVEFCDLTPPPSLVTNLPSRTVLSPVSVAVAVNSDATRIAYAQPTGVAVVDAAGHVVARIATNSPPTGVEFARGVDELLVMTNKALWVWTPGTARPIQIPQARPPIDAQLSADGSTVAAAQIGGVIGVWSAVTGRAKALLRPSAKVRAQYSGPIPIPLRVALSPDGSTVAGGTLWQTVSIWNVSSGRLIAVKAVQTPRDFEIGGFGGSGPFPIAELAFNSDGSRLLAVDFPQIGAGDFQPPGVATVFNPATGAVIAGFQSPARALPAVNPGAALSPDGSFLFAGLLGLSPTPPGGDQAVYEVAGENTLALNLPGVGLPPLSTVFDAPVAAEPWSPDGVDLLAGPKGIYTCDACGSLAQLQDAAARRAAWQQPLSVTHDNPSSSNPYR